MTLHQRLLNLSFGLLLSASASAQLMVMVGGQVQPCNGLSYPIIITSLPGMQPPVNATLSTGGNCTFFFTTGQTTQTGGFVIQYSCDGGITFQSDTAYYNTGLLGYDSVFVQLQCGNVNDCLGVLNGPDMPGTPCDDGDPNTTNDTWSGNCVCVGTGPQYDCLGILNGPNVPGTACDDGDPNTNNDTWNGNCVCVGGGGLPCDAAFMISQAYDSLQNPIPYSLFVYTMNNGPGLSYVWTFGDGGSSTQPYPVHSYNGPGPFLLCLTVTGFGCSNTYCDTIGIDSTGVIMQMMGGQGFTINVMPAGGSNGVDEPIASNEIFAIRPNPVLDVLTVDLKASGSENARMEVLDLTGKVVRTEQARLVAGANTLRMDVSALETGTYVFRLTGPNGTVTQRFVHGR